MAELRSQYDLQMSLYKCSREAWVEYKAASGARTAIAAILKSNAPEEVTTAARAVDTKLAAICGSTGPGRGFGGGFGGGGGAPRQPTFTAINSAAVRQLNRLDSGDIAPTGTMLKACAATCAEFKTVMASWTALKSKDLLTFNGLLEKNRLKPIGSF
jgi:hypothetical protein